MQVVGLALGNPVQPLDIIFRKDSTDIRHDSIVPHLIEMHADKVLFAAALNIHDDILGLRSIAEDRHGIVYKKH